jgi:16S rRNA processing protein RimM
LSSDSGERASEAPAPRAPGKLTVGRVGRAHGLDGSFYVTRAQARMLGLGGHLTVAGRTAEIVRRAGTNKHPIVRLGGVGSRSEAEALRGEELTADMRDAPALAEGEWWAHELEGCAVMDGERLLGTVASMLVLPSCEALEVAPVQGGAVVIVPMVKDAIREVDPARGRIDVDAAFLNLDGENPALAPPPPADGGAP